MTELPRYQFWVHAPDDDSDVPYLCIEADVSGEFVKWADVSLRLQQLEQEKANLLDMHCVSETNASNLERRAQIAEAALAETRAALQQLVESEEFYNFMQAYRHAPATEPELVSDAFLNVKVLILSRVVPAE